MITYFSTIISTIAERSTKNWTFSTH